MKGFLCEKCASCCKVVGLMVETAKNTPPEMYSDPFMLAMNKVLREFPFTTDINTGRCEHLTDKNLCGVYEHRPLACDVDRLYKKLFKHIMSRKDFYKNNHRNCELLRGFCAKSAA